MKIRNNSHFFKNKPRLTSSKFHQGIFKPKNPDKYAGDVNHILYRSGLELKWFKWFDIHPSILQWKCEETVIQYYNPIKQKLSKYFLDVHIKYQKKTSQIREAIIEIKPLEQVKKPVQGKRKTRSYQYTVTQYIVNEAKWNAAKEVANKNGIEFKILTETGFVDWSIK